MARTVEALGSGIGGENVASLSEAKLRRPTGKDSGMADPTREEIDAKLAAVEARIEARLVGIDGKLDRITDQIVTMASQVKESKEAASGAKDAVNSMKWHTLATVLGAVAIILAMWTIWAQGMEFVAALMSQGPSGTGG